MSHAYVIYSSTIVCKCILVFRQQIAHVFQSVNSFQKRVFYSKRSKKFHLKAEGESGLFLRPILLTNSVWKPSSRLRSIEPDASDAFRILSATPMNADSIKRLPFKVVETYLSAKFDKDLLAFVTSSIAELRVLPESVRVETVAKLSGLSIDEVSHHC